MRANFLPSHLPSHQNPSYNPPCPARHNLNEELRMKKQRSAAEGKANEELSASPIKNYGIKNYKFANSKSQRSENNSEF